MLSFVFASQNYPFALAVGIMMGIALLEGVGTLLGFGFSGLLDNLAPDIDLDVDATMDGVDIDPGTGLTKILAWLRVGRVPVLILLVIFLTAFGLLGYFVQAIVTSFTGTMLPVTIAGPLAFVGALPVMRVSADVLSRMMPKDESSAVSSQTFIGRTAVIVIGTATSDKPAEARLKDQHGKSHYVMVKPDNQEDRFSQGAEVLLVRKEGGTFLVIQDTTAEILGQPQF